jgi:hypothetical protein
VDKCIFVRSGPAEQYIVIRIGTDVMKLPASDYTSPTSFRLKFFTLVTISCLN